MNAEEYFEKNITTDWSLESLLSHNTEPQDIGDRYDIILSLNYDPVGVDIVWQENEQVYKPFVYYFDGSGDYIPVEVFFSYEEVIEAYTKDT